MNVWISHNLVRPAVDIKLVLKGILFGTAKRVDDGLTSFDDNKDVLVMCIEQNLQFNGTCCILIFIILLMIILLLNYIC